MSENLRDMRLFVAVYEERSFTVAAQREHATQSGVSHHIRKLEDRRETLLFIRGTGLRVVPTPAADAYYRGCIATLRAYENANNSLREFAGGYDGELAIGLVPTISHPILAPSLLKYIAAHPNVAIQTMESQSVSLIGEVRAGRLDFAIGYSLAGEAGITSTPFARTPCLLVSGQAHSAHKRSVLSLQDIAPLRLAAPPHPNAIRSAVESSLTTHGVHVDRWLEVDSMMVTLEFVSKTDWVSIVPGLVLAREHQRPGLAVSNLEKLDITLDLVLVRPRRKELSHQALAFVEILREELQSIDRRFVTLL